MIDLFNFFKNNKFKRLKDHQFFSLMSYWINVEIDNLPVENEIKKRVVSKFLKIKFSIFEKNFLQYITILEDFDPLQLQNLIVLCIKEYEEEARKKYIPDVFIDKFRHWHSNHVEIAFAAIKSVCESSFYKPPEKVAATLDVLLFLFRLTIIDAENTINNLNGDLETELRGTLFDI